MEKSFSLDPSEMWNEAHERLFAAASFEEYHALIKLTTGTTADEVASYLREHAPTLSPEGIFFLNISEAAKRSQTEP